jgi:hypothetical protein
MTHTFHGVPGPITISVHNGNIPQSRGFDSNATYLYVFCYSSSNPALNFLGTVLRVRKAVRKAGGSELRTEVSRSIGALMSKLVPGRSGSTMWFLVLIYPNHRAPAFHQTAGLPIAGCTALALLEAAR